MNLRRATSARATQGLVTASVPRPILMPGKDDGPPPSPFANVYDQPIAVTPPPPPVAMSTGVANGYEGALIQMKCQDIGGSAAIGPPTVVYSTTQRWRGIDVWISTDFLAALGTGFLTVKIFGVVKGTRSLVATGRTRLTGSDPIRIATARSFIADRFDVTIERQTAPLDPANMSATINVIASDECLPVDNLYEGAITPIAQETVNTPFSGIFLPPPFELVQLKLNNGSGAIRYLQVFDNPVVPTPGLERPRFSFFVGVGDCIEVPREALGRLPFRSGLIVGPSTTPLTYTAPADILSYYSVWFR